MLVLSSFNSQKDKMKTPSNKNKLNLINFRSPQKAIIKLELTENNNYKKPTKNNKNLFLKIKKLITEFEQEKDIKEKMHRFKTKKNSNKKNKKTSNIPPRPNPKIRTSLFVPNKKQYISVPKIKSQMQFNRYLINDFKENDSELDYIKRSLKYQKINEDFDELTLLKQIKEVAKNGIYENAVENTPKNEPEFLETPESEMITNSPSKNFLSKNTSEFSMSKNNNGLKSNIVLNTNIRRLYTDKIKEIPKNFSRNEYSNNRRESITNTNNSTNQNNMNSNNNNINNYTAKTKVTEKENSFNEEKENINDNEIIKSPGIKLLMKLKNKNSESRPKKKQFTSIDKYNFSKRLYFAQMKEYNRYIKKKQYMRGKNFSKQIALINREKEKMGINDIDNDEVNTDRALPKLVIPNLLFQIEYKDIFKNSFNTLRVFEEGDQDLDLDDLNKIRKSIKDYEIEMIKVLKKKNNLKYIKKRFNKTTVGKYQSTKGIYFGA